jgi:hypothetical protein
MNKYWEIQKIEKIALKNSGKKCWKKHGALVNDAKLGGMTPLIKAPCFFFPTGSRDAD